MKKPLERPNLPGGKVCDVAVCGSCAKLLEKLEELNIGAVITAESKNLDGRIHIHTDMLINNISKGVLIADNTQKNNIVNFLTIGYRCDFFESDTKSPYPHDCLLNCVVIGDKLICNPNITHKNILKYAQNNNYDIIRVRQGYSKCSVCIVSDNALITDDESIHKACAINHIDSLYISKGSVKLNGYNYGFIGGCTGLIDKDKLLFNGDINYHKDCGRIIDFLNKYNVSPVIIEDEPLIDIGSILPLTEEIPYKLSNN